MVGLLGCIQENGWFDGHVRQIWIERILKPYLCDAKKSFLLVDHFSVHLNLEFINSVNDLGCDDDFIPAGYTCMLQPLDVGVHATFKKSIRDYHHSWCLENYPKISDKDKFLMPERDDVYKWVVNLFDKVSSESIQKTYKHIGYIVKNAMEEDQNEEEEQEWFFDNGLENEVEIDDEVELLTTESDTTTDTRDDEDEF
jgi:hypothetical protein